MSNIDKQWLQQTIADMEEHRDLFPGDLDDNHENVLAALRIALASLEAEAVAYVDPFAFNNFSVYRAGETDNKRMGREWMWANPDAGLIPVYTAPPSPLAPDLKELEEILDWILMLPCPTPKATHFAKRLAVVIDTCRAAMLQGADGNSPVIPDCSCGTCRPVTFTDSRFVVCSECGNKRCPHENDHRNACTGSNEPGQEGSAYPAAPQQEVSQALAKGMERYGDAMQELAKKEVK